MKGVSFRVLLEVFCGKVAHGFEVFAAATDCDGLRAGGVESLLHGALERKRKNSSSLVTAMEVDKYKGEKLNADITAGHNSLKWQRKILGTVQRQREVTAQINGGILTGGKQR
jgi:hypothetical protein